MSGSTSCARKFGPKFKYEPKVDCSLRNIWLAGSPGIADCGEVRNGSVVLIAKNRHRIGKPASRNHRGRGRTLILINMGITPRQAQRKNSPLSLMQTRGSIVGHE